MTGHTLTGTSIDKPVLDLAQHGKLSRHMLHGGQDLVLLGRRQLVEAKAATAATPADLMPEFGITWGKQGWSGSCNLQSSEQGQ